GYAIDFVASSRAASARKSARFIGGATKALPINQVKPAALTKIATLIIATPDDAIASVANDLAGMLPKRPSGGKRQRVSTIALHTSGALSSGVLRPLQAKGLATGSFHPLVSISDPKVGARWLRRAYFGVEGDPTAIRVASRIVHNLG